MWQSVWELVWWCIIWGVYEQVVDNYTISSSLFLKVWFDWIELELKEKGEKIGKRKEKKRKGQDISCFK